MHFVCENTDDVSGVLAAFIMYETPLTVLVGLITYWQRFGPRGCNVFSREHYALCVGYRCRS